MSGCTKDMAAPYTTAMAERMSTGTIAFTEPPTVDTLATVDTVVGTGATAVSGKTLTVHYTGWLYSETAPNNRGVQFDSSVGHTPFSFQLGAGVVIAGWDRGLLGIKAGGKRTLVIPAELAYGSRASPTIPANSALVFEVEVLTVK